MAQKKILYPVGTKITVVANKPKTDDTQGLPEIVGLSGIVVGYNKGEKHPYIILLDNGRLINAWYGEIREANSEKATEALAKSLKPKTPKSTGEVTAKKALIKQASKECNTKDCYICNYVPSNPYQDTYTTQEVNKLLADVRSEMADKLVELAEVIQTELNDVRNLAGTAYENGFVVADLAERNFKQVSRKFKTLNHDDD